MSICGIFGIGFGCFATLSQQKMRSQPLRVERARQLVIQGATEISNGQKKRPVMAPGALLTGASRVRSYP
jgi:hypothetical protein